jgi:hypothetical protein
MQHLDWTGATATVAVSKSGEGVGEQQTSNLVANRVVDKG